MGRRISSVNLRPLDAAPDAGLGDRGTPESRLALVETLTAEAWALAGRAHVPRPRATLPVRVRPLRPPPTPGTPDRASNE